MTPVVDISAPSHIRRLGAIWFIIPLILVVVWLVASPHRTGVHHHSTPIGVAVER